MIPFLSRKPCRIFGKRISGERFVGGLSSHFLVSSSAHQRLYGIPDDRESFFFFGSTSTKARQAIPRLSSTRVFDIVFFGLFENVTKRVAVEAQLN